MRAAAACLLVLGALTMTGPSAVAAAPPLQPVDPRFEAETVLEGLESPMAVRLAPAPDPRIFVAEKSGRVLAFEGPGDDDPTVVVDLTTEVHDFWDRGLLGMAIDPAFALNGRLYLLYTRDAEIGGDAPRWGDTCPDPPGATAAGCVASGALVRVTVDAFGVASEVRTLIEDEWCQQFPSHSLGTVAFGPDGMLYVSAGDGASFSQRDWGQLPGRGPYPANPCGDPPDEGGSMRSQDVRTPADPTGLIGAIARIDPATGAGAAGNPFPDGDAGARRLIAYGLRNPFRFAFRPGTDELWLGDVGEESWEEINVVADADDAVAENFGWPCHEGPAPNAGWEGVPGCEALHPSEVTPPRLAYAHGRELVPGDGCRGDRGSAVSGIAFPSGYGEEAAGSLFFADYARACIFAMAPGRDGAPDPAKISLFARGPGPGGAVELHAAPGGELYYTYFDPLRPWRGSVHRIRQVSGNRAPVPAISAAPPYGPVPLTVAFSAAASTDPDGDELEFAWDLDGDGAYDDATGERAESTYALPGVVRAGVRVGDDHGASATAHVSVAAGNTPPRPVIEAPVDGARWSVGESIGFRGSAGDDEEALDPAALRWVVALDHCPTDASACHAHPFERVAGPAGEIVGPEHDYPSSLVLTLLATDSGGLTSSRSVRLDPRAAVVRALTDAPGTVVSVDGVRGADVRRTVIAGARVTVAAEPWQHAHGALWSFGGWSDGAFAASRELAPHGDVTLTARFARAPAPAPAPTPEPAAATPPPQPQPGASSAVRAPRIRVRKQVVRRLGKVVRLSVGCAPGCRLKARAVLRAAGAGRRLPAPRSHPRRGGRRFELRLPRRARAAARRALRRGRPARMTVTLTARGGDGGRRTARVRVRLKLR